MIQIRKATEADAESLSELNHAFNEVNRSTEAIQKTLKDASSTETTLLVEEAGLIVGFICFQTIRSICYDKPWVEITELYISDNHRRKHAGYALVCAAMSAAKEKGASEIIPSVITQNRPLIIT
jgi:predicted N-acetyltransferase YhbS